MGVVGDVSSPYAVSGAHPLASVLKDLSVLVADRDIRVLSQ